MDGQELTSKPTDDVHYRALRRFDDCAIPQTENRQQSLQARRFAFIPGAQWEGEFGDPWVNRIRIEINKVLRAIRKIESDYRSNRIVPDFRPSGGQSDDDTAETLDGMHRADSHYYKSQQARDNAVLEALGGGFGAYRLLNCYDDENDPQNDYQRINPASIITDADQCVFFDVNSKLYDKSDARYAFVVTEWARDAFEDQWPGMASDWPKISERHWDYDWYEPDVVRVAEYYEKRTKREALYVFTHPLLTAEERYWASDLSDELKAEMQMQGWDMKTQLRKRTVVFKWVLTGAEILDGPKRIPGSRIPIVPVYGQRWFVDGQERWKGVTQDKMDSQRAYNASVSRVAELAATSVQETPIVAPEQVEGNLADIWANRAINRPAYLPLNPLYNPDGSIAQVGPMSTLSPPQPTPADAALLQIANQDLIEDDVDGAETVKANVSAEAMDIAASRVDAKSGVYLDNIRQSVQCEGEIYLGMVTETHAEPGREVPLMDEDGGDAKAVLFERFTDKTGVSRVRNDFSRGRYKVVASVSEATATRRDKTVRSALNMAEVSLKAGDTDMAQACVLTAVYNSDGEGIKELKDYARRKGLQSGLFTPNEDEKKALEEAAQAPDPNSELVAAQAADLQAGAIEKAARADKAVADTRLSEAKVAETEAKTIETLAKVSEPRRLMRGYELGGQSLQ